MCRTARPSSSLVEKESSISETDEIKRLKFSCLIAQVESSEEQLPLTNSRLREKPQNPVNYQSVTHDVTSMQQ